MNTPMLNELNTIVQFLAALYVTITIDNIVIRRFWTPDLYMIVKKTLTKFDFALSSPAQEGLLASIQASAAIVEKQSRLRGAYFLLLCISILVFNCFESNISDTASPVFYFSILVTLIVACLFYIYGMYRWIQWRSIIICYVILLLVFTLNVLLPLHIDSFNGWRAWMTSYVTTILILDKIFIIALLSIPILIRLFLNWLNSSVYVNCLNEKLNKEYESYKKTADAIKTKNRKNCDAKYDEVYKDVFYSNTLTEDNVNTAIVKKLVEYLEKTCAPMTSWQLLWYRIKNRKVINNTNKAKSLPTTYELPTGNQVPEQKVSFAKITDEMIVEYNNLVGVSLFDFAKRKGIDAATFKRERKKYNKLHNISHSPSGTGK